MAKRRVLKLTPILITLNILVLFLIVMFYSTRLLKYYLKEHGRKSEETVLLVNEIKKHQSYLDETKGLVYNEEKKNYTYKGEVNDNYLYYSGFMFRILGIDSEDNIKLVSEDNVTLLYPGFNNGYESSYVNKWLNSSEEKYSGVFENTLINAGGLLNNTTYCMDSIDDLSKIVCEESSDKYKITLLSLYDFKSSGGKAGFLNNGTTFNLGTLNSSNQNYFVNESGEISLNNKTSRAITIKPVITINSGAELVGGNGKKNNPYIIEKHDVKVLADTYINNIIKIDNSTYKVIEIEEDKVKLTSTDALKEKDEKLSISFGGSNSAYSASNTVGSYLNKTFLNSLSVKDSVISSDYYTGVLSLDNLDYSKTYNSKVNTKVGLLNIGDLYINEVNNVFTILRGMEATNIINVINENGNLFADSITSKYNVRPTFYLDGKLNIIKGEGTMSSPYELGVNNEKETKEE